MKLLSWNINGYRAALKKGFAGFLLKEQPDIIGLQEMKVMREQLSPEDISLDGYKLALNSAERKGYSGVGVFYREEPLSVETGLGERRFDCEGRLLQLEYPGFWFVNCYFPQGGRGLERVRYKLEFYDSFLERIEKLRATGRPVIFCGDVNTAHKPVDLSHPKNNAGTSGFLPEERAWMDKLEALGWVDTFRVYHPEPLQYTWWDYKTRARTRNIGWRLDYFFINKEKISAVRDAYTMPSVMGSDHCPVGVELEIK